jgi:error-prone DNA polymerase
MPGDLAAAAARLELPAMAVCDRDGFYGTPRFYHAANEAGVRPLVGTEITLRDGTVLPLLAASRTGYQNLCQLISHAKQESRSAAPKSEIQNPKSKIAAADLRERKRPCYATWDEVAQYSEGVIALTGDAEGPLLSAWQTGGTDAVAAPLDQLQRIFGSDRLYVEVQRHRVRGEERTVRFLRDLAANQNLPLLATGGITHADRSARTITDIFTCLRNHTTLDAAGRLLAPNAERQVRSGRFMTAKFADLPDAITNTVRLADRLDFTLRDLGYAFPDYPVPPWDNMLSHLRHLVYAGIRDLIPRMTQKYRRQIDAELTLIDQLGFCGYFLIVADICRWARSHGILVQGRGSAANSVVCYALRITAIDPVKNHLLFERFLSEGRVGADGRPSWPDIDLDLPSGKLRESVIQEVYRRYSPHGAAMTANVITYRGRGATRELGKVLGLSDDIMDRFSRLFHGGDFPHTLELEEQLAKSGLPRAHLRAATLAQLHQQLHGLPRHLGQHSGGMIICGGRLNQVVPLEPASMPNRVVVQWDKDDCEDLGIVKVDLLGLGMMATLQDCFELCADRGEELSLYNLPADDPKTYRMMQEADTIGVFQIESRAQMSSLRRFKPACFYDVAMQVAIVRPGPIVGQLVHPIIARRHGGEPIVCLDPEVHERLLPILKRTYGVVLFQEQMLACAMELANYNGTQAEELRRAMGFSRGTERLERGLNNLRTAMREHGWSDRIIEMLIESASNFALYGFPESHSMSFALLAYASTWLKAHRPAEFVASLLNNQPMGFYGPATLVQDSRRHGVQFLPVCVQNSHWECAVEMASPSTPKEQVANDGAKSQVSGIPPSSRKAGLRRTSKYQEAEEQPLLAAEVVAGVVDPGAHATAPGSPSPATVPDVSTVEKPTGSASLKSVTQQDGMSAEALAKEEVHFSRPAPFPRPSDKNSPTEDKDKEERERSSCHTSASTDPSSPTPARHSSASQSEGRVRLGLCYLKGLSEKNTRAMLEARAERPFADIDDWLRRTHFSAADRRVLAASGALNSFAEHRRAALWQIEAAWSADEPLLQRAASPLQKCQVTSSKYQEAEEQPLLAAEVETQQDGTSAEASAKEEVPLCGTKEEVHFASKLRFSDVAALETRPDPFPGPNTTSTTEEKENDKEESERFDPSNKTLPDPAKSEIVDRNSETLSPMSLGERVQADFTLMGLTAGVHPMAHVRHALPDVWRASDLPLAKNGSIITVAGSVICRQRPGTAKGFVFISLEDETGVANCIVTPPKFEAYRLVINLEPALRITGQLQIQHGIIHIKATTIAALHLAEVPAQASHDFH